MLYAICVHGFGACYVMYRAYHWYITYIIYHTYRYMIYIYMI